jgi:hypothetical protein
MWREVFVLLAVTKLCKLQKEDYEYEAVSLTCSYEMLNEE